MKSCIFIFFLSLFSSAYAQNINSYKYVIIPRKFSFLKTDDEYSLNSITRQLLENRGFTVFFDGAQLPKEITGDKCIALNADVLNKGNMFITSLVLTLKDCHGNAVFTSKEGTSRDKDYDIAYTKALRDAFLSLYQLPYNYDGSNGKPAQSVAVTTDTAVQTTVEKQTIAKTPVKAIEADQQNKTLYAQPIPNGYQLIDTTPKKILTLLKTSVENYFIASNDTVSGIVLKVNGDWFFEYYSNDKLITEKLVVKF